MMRVQEVHGSQRIGSHRVKELITGKDELTHVAKIKTSQGRP